MLTSVGPGRWCKVRTGQSGCHPMVIVTKSLVGCRAETWLVRTSAVLASEQVTNVNWLGDARSSTAAGRTTDFVDAACACRW